MTGAITTFSNVNFNCLQFLRPIENLSQNDNEVMILLMNTDMGDGAVYFPYKEIDTKFSFNRNVMFLI